MKRTTLIAVVLLILLAGSTSANPGDTILTRAYGDSAADNARDIEALLGGGYIIAGSTESYGAGLNDCSLMRLDEVYNLLWFRTYGGAEEDIAVAVKQVDDDYIFLGETQSFGAGQRDLYLVRADSDGEVIWERTYGGSDMEYAASLELAPDGGLVLFGHTRSYGAGNYDMYCVKTDSAGNLQWEQTYGGSEYEDGRSITAVQGGGYLLTGGTSSFGAGNKDYYAVKIDENGEVEWSNTYGDSGNDMARDVEPTLDNGFILGGYSDSFSKSNFDILIVKIDSLGTQQWQRTHGTNVIEFAFAIEQTQDDGYVIAGHSIVDGFYGDFSLIKTNSSGWFEWGNLYGSDFQEVAYSIEITEFGNYLLIGDTNGYGNGMLDVYLVLVEGDNPNICCDVEMTPDDSQVVVNPGGSFGLTGILSNPYPEATETDFWVGVIYEEQFFLIQKILDIPMEPLELAERYLNQMVPDYAPAGSYEYVAYCGDFDSGEPCDSVSFSFTVTDEQTGFSVDEWRLHGGWRGLYEAQRDNFAINNYPNPFNSSTTISYELQSPSEITLEVYNIAGQRLVELDSGAKGAGRHRMTWNADRYSTGVYFCKLTIGESRYIERMTLIK
ncbi:MAG: T9SS type A sorting domain-containing protein [candidate division Zixibacteria bacterium]|nr:T9SS type A sorting domain-containing protein [candidate division Zixibacteria bacterium]